METLSYSCYYTSMDLNKIATFVRAMDAGSFTKAAQLLKQPKSRVARNVAALEKALGISLIYRTTRQFSPTEAGRALHERCRDLVYSLEGATSDLREAGAEVSGRLRVTAADDLGSVLLGGVIAEMITLHPRVDVDLILSNEYVDLVKERIDLGIRIGTLDPTGHKSRRIGRMSLALVASPAYLRTAPRLTRPRDLESHRILYFKSDPVEDLWHLRASDGSVETVRLKPHCWANNPKVLIDLALSDQGVTLVPEFLCLDALKARRLKRVLTNHLSEPVPIQFVWPSQREPSQKVRAFMDLALKRIGPIFRHGAEPSNP